MSLSASWMIWRTRARVSPLQSPSSSIRAVMFAEAVSSFGCLVDVIVLLILRSVRRAYAERSNHALDVCLLMRRFHHASAVSPGDRSISLQLSDNLLQSSDELLPTVACALIVRILIGTE